MSSGMAITITYPQVRRGLTTIRMARLSAQETYSLSGVRSTQHRCQSALVRLSLRPRVVKCRSTKRLLLRSRRILLRQFLNGVVRWLAAFATRMPKSARALAVLHIEDHVVILP